jgi:adenylyltransferase/sulfurtransferase
MPRYAVVLTDDAGTETTILVRPDGQYYTKQAGRRTGSATGRSRPTARRRSERWPTELIRADRQRRPPTRYHRQTILPQIGPGGERALAAARVLLVGCGALGTSIAEQLVRAGVGFLRIVDRDVVELTNLQRQVLFDEADAAAGTPKAVAAARRLAAVNSAVTVDRWWPTSTPGTSRSWPAGPTPPARRERFVHLLLDGTDNVETRYLLNDVSVKHGVPWVYGACVGTRAG